MRAWLAALLVTAACGDDGGTPAMCEVRTPLVDHTRWTQVPADLDPFRVEGTRCDETHMRLEDFSGETSYTVETRGCSWTTVEQPALAGVTAGEAMNFRLWYFSQDNFQVAEASLIVALGATPLWTQTVPLPSAMGGLLIGTLPAPRDIVPGEPITWHVGNHGVNSWNLIEVSLSRLMPCPEGGGS